MNKTSPVSLALVACSMLQIALAVQLVRAGRGPLASHYTYLITEARSGALLTSGQPVGAQDYKAQYPQEYAFFRTAFDDSNGNNFGPERDSVFSVVSQKVEALQKAL